MKQTNHVLITGSSMGIGKAIAMECAARGMNVYLVALDSPELAETAREIKRAYQVEAAYLGIDLTRPNAALSVFQWIRDQQVAIDTLINNAGMGNSGLFEDNDIAEYLKIIELNNRSMVELTYYFFNHLKSNGAGRILNVSSMEATLPLPYKAVYTGSKSFIYAFSLAIREELRGSGISVTVLCPGPVITNQQGAERIEAHKNKGKILRDMMIAYPDLVARKAVNGMLRGKRVVIPKVAPWTIVKLMKFVPTGMKMNILERIFRVYK